MLGVWLILSEAKLCLLPVDGRRNPKPTATLIVHLTASDSKAIAELALQNLVRDIPQAPLSAGRTGEILKKAAGLASEGKNVIQSDLVQKMIGTVPAIDNFVTAMDKIADVCTF